MNFKVNRIGKRLEYLKNSGRLAGAEMCILEKKFSRLCAAFEEAERWYSELAELAE